MSNTIYADRGHLFVGLLFDQYLVYELWLRNKKDFFRKLIGFN